MYGDTSSEGLVIENADIDVARMVRASGNSMSGFMMMRCELLKFLREVGRQLYSRLNDKKNRNPETSHPCKLLTVS